MAKKPPVTRAVHALRKAGVSFESHLYRYEPRGGTANSSAALGVSEHSVIKTLLFEDGDRQPLVVLMHGDREVSTKQLARVLSVRTITACDPSVADRHSGYQVGGTSPFGTRRPIRTFVEESILELDRIFINGGARGYAISLAPQDMLKVLPMTPVNIAVPERPDG